MKLDPNLEQIAEVSELLEENIDPSKFDAAIAKLEANPALMESLMAVQFVSDAVHGNSCPDKRYTARIMQFIAASEQRRIDDEACDK